MCTVNIQKWAFIFETKTSLAWLFKGCSTKNWIASKQFEWNEWFIFNKMNVFSLFSASNECCHFEWVVQIGGRVSGADFIKMLDSFDHFWNGSHAIPLQRPFLTKIFIQYTPCKYGPLISTLTTDDYLEQLT